MISEFLPSRLVAMNYNTPENIFHLFFIYVRKLTRSSALIAFCGDKPLPSSINIPSAGILQLLRNSCTTSVPEAVDPLFLNDLPSSFRRVSA